MNQFLAVFTPLVCSLVLVVLLFAIWYAPRLWSAMNNARQKERDRKRAESEELYEAGARTKLLKEIEATIIAEQWHKQWLLETRCEAYEALFKAASHYRQMPAVPTTTLMEALSRCQLLASSSMRVELDALAEFLSAQRGAELTDEQRKEFHTRLHAVTEKARADLGVY